MAVVGRGNALEFPPLTFLAEGDEVTVGRPDRDIYAILPPDGAAVLRRLLDGSTPADAAGWYAETYGQPLDIDDFVGSLRELELLGPAAAVPPPRWQRLGRAVFSPVAWAGYAALVGCYLAALARTPGLAPHYGQLFFSRSLVVMELVLFVGQLPGVLLHESFHALAGRRAGLRSRLRVGWRLYYLVVVTEMDGLVGLPRGKRYLPILAGLLADLLWCCLLTLAAAMVGGGVGAACLGLAFATVLRAGWQFQFYLRTDLYVLVSTVLRLPDLHGAARFVLRRPADRLRQLLRRPPAPPAGAARWRPRELWHARWYAGLLVVGYAVSLGTLAVAVLPAAARMLSILYRRLADPGPAGAGGIADSTVFLLLNVAQLTVVGVLARRARRAARAGQPAVSAGAAR